MKLGTFVGKQFLEIPIEEQNTIEQQIKKVVFNSFSNPGKYEITKRVSEHGVHFKIENFSSDELRDHFGNTYIPSYINVFITKQAGYDQAVHGPVYDHKDGFVPPYDITSYSCTVDLIGTFRRYRGKRVDHYIGIGGTEYSFGTELTDINYQEAIRKISNYYFHSTLNTGAPLI